jgi:hypothetical protein
MSTQHLKIKIQSLAAEARIIRSEEKQQKRRRRWCAAHTPEKYSEANDAFWSLRKHRHGVVGTEARVSLLAYGFLRGVAYATMEASVNHKNHPDFGRVENLATRFGGAVFSKTAWEVWLLAAKAHLEGDAGAVRVAPVLEVAHG